MKGLLHLFVFIGLTIAASDRAHALAVIKPVKTPAELKELGPTIHLEKDSTNTVGVTIEFKAEGKLQDYSSAHLEVKSGERTIVSVPLTAYKKADGYHRLYISVDRDYLKNTTVILYTGHDGYIEGYYLKLADLAELPAAKNGQ